MPNKILEERIVGHRDFEDERWRGHAHEHQLLANAAILATAVLDDRLRKLNEFRAALSDQSHTFATRDLLDSMENQFNTRMSVLTDRVVVIEKGDVKNEGKSLGQSAVIALIIAAAGFILTVLTIVIIVANFTAT